MPLDKDDIVSAQVVLKSASGDQLGPDTLVTSKNIRKFSPPAGGYSQASKAFRTMGFQTGELVGPSFSITATVDQFETAFKLRLQQNRKGGVESVEGDLELTLEYLETDLRDIIQTIIFSDPPDFGPTEYV